MIVAADLVHKKAGDNPHLWYDPPTMPAVAEALAAALSAADPAHKDGLRGAAARPFSPRSSRSNEKIAALAGKYAGVAGHRERAGVRLHGGRARS